MTREHERVTVRVIEAGPGTTAQDLGRPFFADQGVSPSGAADPEARAMANRLVGNHPGAAVLEVTMGGLRFEVDGSTMVAVTGAPVDLTVGGRAEGMGHAVHVGGGEQVILGRPRVGVRTYVAVRGGLATSGELTSRSTDTLSGLGPEPIRAGDSIPIGEDIGSDANGPRVPVADPVPLPPIVAEPTIRLHAGPRFDWFDPESLADLQRMPWLVDSQADRIGVRFDGPPLRRIRSGELPSEPMLLGAMQVPPDGRPIVFGPDHPSTGGYPVVAVVHPEDRRHLAQVRPGDLVRFRWASSHPR